MNKLEKYIDVCDFEGEGYSHVVDFGAWTAAVINYAPRFDEAEFNKMERHNETDEVFILVEGSAKLYYGGDLAKPESVDMIKHKFYNVRKGMWHGITVSRDARVIIVENADTGTANSDYYYFK